jgi:hypothetical protein
VFQKKPAAWHGSMGQPSMRQSNATPPRAAVSLPSIVATACAMATMAAQPASAAQPATAAQPDTAAHSATPAQPIRVRVQSGLLVGTLDNAVESFIGHSRGRPRHGPESVRLMTSALPAHRTLHHAMSRPPVEEHKSAKTVLR